MVADKDRYALINPSAEDDCYWDPQPPERGLPLADDHCRPDDQHGHGRPCETTGKGVPAIWVADIGAIQHQYRTHPSQSRHHGCRCSFAGHPQPGEPY